jgi:hypothetical protein
MLMEAWLSEYYWNEARPTTSNSVGVLLDGNDHLLTNVIVFDYTKVGITRFQLDLSLFGCSRLVCGSMAPPTFCRQCTLGMAEVYSHHPVCHLDGLIVLPQGLASKLRLLTRGSWAATSTTTTSAWLTQSAWWWKAPSS